MVWAGVLQGELGKDQRRHIGYDEPNVHGEKRDHPAEAWDDRVSAQAK
jgi:hypothetical protein